MSLYLSMSKAVECLFSRSALNVCDVRVVGPPHLVMAGMHSGHMTFHCAMTVPNYLLKVRLENINRTSSAQSVYSIIKYTL